MSGPAADAWMALRALTSARVGLGRSGASLPTSEVLAFALDHARARDAVQLPLDAERVADEITALGLGAVIVESAAPDRPSYLRRPDLGRRLSDASRTGLGAAHHHADLALVVADGLSSAAIHAHAAPLIAALQSHIAAEGWRLAEVAVARQARVALGDEIGERVAARMTVMLIGERPGLSAPDSLGAYLTHAPRVGRTDAERNCVSNIRPAGLGYEAAAFRIAWLVRAAFALGATGVALKDDSGLEAASLDPPADRLAIPGTPATR